MISCTKVKNVHKELLQLCHHHQCQACTQVPCARDFWEIHQLRELPFPQSWYEHTETTELLSEYPCSRLYRFRELSPFSCQLNLVSSEALTPPPPIMLVNCACTISSCTKRIVSLKIGNAISRSCKFLDCKEHIHHKFLCRCGN